MEKCHYTDNYCHKRYRVEKCWLVYHYDLDHVEDELLKDVLSSLGGSIIYREDKHKKLGTCKYPVVDFIEFEYDWYRKDFESFCDDYYKFYMLRGIWNPTGYKETLRKEGKIS